MRRKLPALLALPLIVTVTSLACGLGPVGEVATSLDGDTLTGALDKGRYLVATARQVASLTRSQGNLDGLLGSPEFGNLEWTGSVRAQLAVINVVCDQLGNVSAPPEMASVHKGLVDACGNCRRAANLVLDGVDNLDQAAIQRAVQSGLDCTTQLQSNRAALGELATRLGAEVPNLELPELGGLGNLAELGNLDAPAIAPPTVNTGSNLRAGPGTNYDRVGGLAAGTVVAVAGRNQAGDWLAIEAQGVGQVWIAAFLIDNLPDLNSLPILPVP